MYYNTAHRYLLYIRIHCYIVILFYIDTIASTCDVCTTSLAAVGGVLAVSIIYSIVLSVVVIILCIAIDRKNRIIR